MKHTENLINQTTELWKSEYSIEISRETAREILDSAVKFFEILDRWDKADQALTNPKDNQDSYPLMPSNPDKEADQVGGCHE